MLLEILGGVFGYLVTLLMVGLPLFVLAWLVRTLALMRRDQQRLVEMVGSIEAEVRAQGDRQRWGKP
jgi:hypothetical protein